MMKREVRKCKIENCEKKIKAQGLCVKHLSQLYRHGKVLKRTRCDPNEFMTKGKIAKVFLYDISGKQIAETIIDRIMIEKIRPYKWHLNKRGYANTNSVDGKMLLLHHLLLGKPPRGLMTDHINRNKLDNRIANLRFVTHTENSINRNPRADNSSGVTGVYRRKKDGKWYARITVEGMQLGLGTFEKFDEAVKARRSAEQKYFAV